MPAAVVSGKKKQLGQTPLDVVKKESAFGSVARFLKQKPPLGRKTR
jgi:hypothetical protein